MTDEYVTSGEFGRWRADFRESMGRLDQRLDAGFKGVHDRLDDLNGRTRKNSEWIVGVEAKVDHVLQDGCAQLSAHRRLLESSPLDEGGAARQHWARDKRTYGGIGLGGAAVALLYELAQLAHRLMTGG